MELSDLEAAAPRFVRECRDIKSLSANTISAYEQDLAEFRVFFGATESEREVDATFVGDYIQWLRETRELKPATIRRRIACLKSFCRWLKEQRLAEQSPFDEKNIVVRIPKRLPRALTRSQASQVARAISGGAKAASIAQQGSARQLQPETLPDPCDPIITTYLAVSLMLASGMRVGELTAIRLGDIDPTCSVINITGKGSRERTVFLTNPRLVGELDRYVSARIEQCAADDVLLRNARGRALTPTGSAPSLAQAWRSACLLATPHPAPFPPYGRDDPAGGRCRHPLRPAPSRAFQHFDNRDLHACDGCEPAPGAGACGCGWARGDLRARCIDN